MKSRSILLRSMAVAVLLGLSGCRGCARQSGPDNILDLASEKATAVVHVANLQSAASDLNAFATLPLPGLLAA